MRSQRGVCPIRLLSARQGAPAAGESLADILKALVPADHNHAAQLQAVLAIVRQWNPAEA